MKTTTGHTRIGALNLPSAVWLSPGPSIAATASVKASSFGRYTQVQDRSHLNDVLLDDYFHLQQDCNLMSVDIGKFSSIASMVRIGNGAVVGSNSVVTKDVALYTIVGGVAAKTIRQRFPRDIAHALESTA
jgi:acetyltransferase-like isoleucine patch superfamily enzyme